MIRPRPVRETGRGALRTLAGLALVVAALGGLPGHVPDAAARTPQAPAGPAPGDEGQAAYLAEQLRRDAVHVSDQMPRVVPRSSASEFKKQAARTGVPTYVLVLPTTATVESDGLLAAVHDRLGRDGLYVLVSEAGYDMEAEAFGVDAPADAATRAVLHAYSPGTDPLRTFTRFVDTVALEPADAEARADKAENGHGEDGPAPLHITATDRDAQSRLTGTLLAGVPLLIVFTGCYVYWWRRFRGPGPAVLLPVAGAVAVGIGLGAPHVFDETRATGEPAPTERDMTARVERVADGLRRGPVYADPESQRSELTAGRLEALTKRAEASGVPVRVAIVPMLAEDESGGGAEWFAGRLRASLGHKAVYIVAHPGRYRFEAFDLGAGIDDTWLTRRLDAVNEQAYRDDEEEINGSGGGFPRLDERIGDFVPRLDGAAHEPQTELRSDPMPPDDPVEEDSLPPLYSAETTAGAWNGAYGAAGATAAVAALLAGGRRIRRARHGAAVPRGTTAASPQAPPRPGRGWLRNTAAGELAALNADFEQAAEELPAGVRTRAWECLDAATLLLDREGDSRIDDVDDATLAAAVVLLRAGAAAVHGVGAGEDRSPGDRLCALNPLHGPATAEGRFVWPSTRRARTHPLCRGCLDAVGKGGKDAAEKLLLRLSAGRSVSPYLPYGQLPGPLGGARSGGITTAHLIRDVREQLGVH